jgi:hypothetical protein
LPRNTGERTYQGKRKSGCAVETQRVPSGAESPTGDEDVNVGVISQVLRPGVEDDEDGGAGTEMPGIGGGGE